MMPHMGPLSERPVSGRSYVPAGGYGGKLAVGVGVGAGVAAGLGNVLTRIVTVTLLGAAVTPGGTTTVTTTVTLPKSPFSDIAEVVTESSALSRSWGPDSNTVDGDTALPTHWCPGATLPVPV